MRKSNEDRKEEKAIERKKNVAPGLYLKKRKKKNKDGKEENIMRDRVKKNKDRKDEEKKK